MPPSYMKLAFSPRGKSFPTAGTSIGHSRKNRHFCIAAQPLIAACRGKFILFFDKHLDYENLAEERRLRLAENDRGIVDIHMTDYPKRLIEVDLPIARISAHARQERSSRLGHIPQLHIYPAARPVAACRAVLCAAIWPDPAGEGCPEAFVETAQETMVGWAQKYASEVSAESFDRVVKIQKDPALLEDRLELRHALLDFIADFANWDNSTSQPLSGDVTKIDPSGPITPWAVNWERGHW